MRVVLIAYEFPPSPSPQSLRWTYLSRELVAQGHEVHVLTIDLGGTPTGLPALPDALVVHRTFAGPVRGTLAGLRHLRGKAKDVSAVASDTRQPNATTRRPRSWKQTLSDQVQGAASKLVFPDVRGEWHRWGVAALERLLADIQPDVVISSHEPATTLELGVLARKRGFRWIADLGDPVLAPYTPARWRERAHLLERETCALADHVLVTNEAARKLMAARHQRTDRISVLTQGYDATVGNESMSPLPEFDATRLELLYTGSFYSFRMPDEILAALHAFPKARLNIAAVTVPAPVLAAATRMPDQVRLLGFMAHLDAVRLQRRAHVLLNIANEDPSQVPGKFYEYLGAGRPILHLHNQPDDAIGQLIMKLQRGWTCRNHQDDISAVLDQLGRDTGVGGLGSGLATENADITAHSWKQLALGLQDILLRVTAR